MFSKNWLVIKDDTKHTFEVCGQAANDNAFHNATVAMQRAGMNVSTMILPVGSKYSNKDVITVIGYAREEGLQARLQKQYRDITMSGIDLDD
jgi:hypothetical protein